MPPTSLADQRLSAPPATTRAALVVTLLVAVPLVVATAFALPRHASLAAADRALARLTIANAPVDEWTAASDAHPSHARLAFRAASLLEDIAAARPASDAVRALFLRAASYYERAADADPFNGLALLRRARATLAATPRAERDALRDDLQRLVKRAFEISPSDPLVAADGFSLLLRGLGDLDAAERLARRKLAVDRRFIRHVAEVASIAAIPVATIIDRFIPPELLAERPAQRAGALAAGSATFADPDVTEPLDATAARPADAPTAPVAVRTADRDPDAAAPEPVLSLLGAFYVERLLVPELTELILTAIDRGDLVRQLTPVAPAIVDLLVADADGTLLARRFWLALHRARADGWPDRNLIFSGDLDRTMITGGFSWSVETTGAFFSDWRRTPPVDAEFEAVDDAGMPLPYEAIALGRHPNQRRGNAQISQRLPVLAPGAYRLSFYQSMSSRSFNDVLRVRLMGIDTAGQSVHILRRPRLTSEWSRVTIDFTIPDTLVNTRLIVGVDARELSPSLDVEFVLLDYFTLVRVGDTPSTP